VRSWGLSAAEQDELWARWRRGQSLRLIARQLGKRGPAVRAFVLRTGGVQHHPPSRAQRSLSMAEREDISRGVAAGDSCRQIAARRWRALSWQLSSGASSSQCAPVGPSGAWWNDRDWVLEGERTSPALSNPRTVTLSGRMAATLAPHSQGL
jgi:hypothetical protein